MTQKKSSKNPSFDLENTKKEELKNCHFQFSISSEDHLKKIQKNWKNSKLSENCQKSQNNQKFKNSENLKKIKKSKI